MDNKIKFVIIYSNLYSSDIFIISGYGYVVEIVSYRDNILINSTDFEISDFSETNIFNIIKYRIALQLIANFAKTKTKSVKDIQYLFNHSKMNEVLYVNATEKY